MTPAPPLIARVLVLPAAGDTGPLDYGVGEPERDRLRIGMRVIVPLGTRRAVGIVTEFITQSPHARLKTILEVVDRHPIVDVALLDLCRWMADYYLCSFAEALMAALPGSVQTKMELRVQLSSAEPTATDRPLDATATAILASLAADGSQSLPALERRCGAGTRRSVQLLRRRGVVAVEQVLRPASGRTRHVRYYQVARALSHDEEALWMRRRPAAHRLYAYLAEHPLGRAMIGELAGTFPDPGGKLRGLQAAGLVTVVEEEWLREVLAEPPPVDRPVSLSASQSAAVAEITTALEEGFRPFLLFGVTGSGKTEVYLHAIAACLARGESALVLVPEISLTHQIVDRIRARFRSPIAVLHSALSDGERWDEWRRIAGGEVRIVVGARSAVFAPLPQLGLIVVDEEHDPAYKQEDGIRYNGRDLAVMRGKLSGCPAVLGSATPSLESYVNARSDRYRLLALPERVESRPLPTIDLVDLRRAGAVAKAALVSPPLRAALSANLAAGNQSLVFLNRRGFANFLQCHQCGDVLQCPNCSVSLTLHQRRQALRCHHCDHTIPIPSACPSCSGMALSSWGAGTEQVEAALGELIAGARVARLDRDTTSRKGSQREILAGWARGDKDILVGTQMIAKGHDVHAVTLVGVLLADSGLNFPDFRAGERTFQTLAQVAGRAGRGDRPGRVIIQTFQPEHPSLRFAQHHDFRGFAEHELASRRELGFPPYGRLIQLRCEGEDAGRVETIAKQLAAALESEAPAVSVLGPALAPLEKVRRRWRWQLLLRGKDSGALRRAARRARQAVRAAAKSAEVHVIVDVDPYSML